jgi:uncharacterized membrane protein
MAEPDPQTLLDVSLRPHRSLQLGGFRLVMVLVAIASFIASIPFIVLYIALRSSFNAAKSVEHLNISPFDILLRKVDPSGEVREWHFNPLWTRLTRDVHDEFGVQRVTLVSRGEAVAIGQFLSPDEKDALWRRLSAALTQAKRGPDYSKA